MTCSIYHLFHNLLLHKDFLKESNDLEKLPIYKALVSCRGKGKFPDIGIRLNQDKSLFSGGELVEFKDSHSYNISSFNSTIPTGKKEINSLISEKKSKIKEQMEAAGDDINSLPIREVFYLVRGRKNDNTKVCLIHGSFFETIPVSHLIKESFAQVLEEALREGEQEIKDDVKEQVINLFSQQSLFSKVRNLPEASVKLRFRVMTEVKNKANALNEKTYPQIPDNTINFILPFNNDINKEDDYISKMKLVFGEREYSQIREFTMKHLLDGDFLVFQTSL